MARTRVRDWIEGVADSHWKAVSVRQMGLASLGFLWFFYLLKSDEDGFVFLDFVNLVFHEAGHPIFGMLGETWGLYGGTIGQLVFPAVAAAAFLRQREPIGYAVAVAWFFENFLNIARYMGDARGQILPLVGEGEHDWTNIFTRWGVLTSDVTIAHAVGMTGWLGMFGVWISLGWRYVRS